MEEAIGWASSVILVLTVAKQVYKQWKEKSSQGVSKWLFLGQMAASSGFVVYSWMVENWVFVVTNSLMLANGLTGYALVLLQRRRGAAQPEQDQAKPRRGVKLHGSLGRNGVAAGRARALRPVAAALRSRKGAGGGGKRRDPGALAS
ncbi:uncharacterized protein SOCE26_088190 [Sorangium cellulosum]|uniref:Uncharacterized protein n=1 Tax=Sorangium cellulosum TaxID=56 RepID=A0A2L0F719_SORCE|nr:PQ-loop repeat-containing protein [Sorangium cellulosum]AUX47301.1 uncharacterized protein SOCE26_088190 [Sorangium cellulosum]